MPTNSDSETRTQKLFRNGGSQAVRIPKGMNFDTDEVVLHREGDRLIIEPKAKTLRSLSSKMGKPLEWDWNGSDAPVEPAELF